MHVHETWWAKSILATVVVFGACIGVSRGQDAIPVVEPRADALLKRMSETLAQASQFTFETRNLVDEVTETGQKFLLSRLIAVQVRRPNAIVADVKGDMQQFRFVYDGKSVFISDPQSGEYATATAPENIDATLDMLAKDFGMALPLADVLVSDPYQSLIQRVRAGLYLGIHDVDGVACHHLAFRQDAVDWQIWIEEGDKPLPRRISIDYKLLPARPQFTATLSKWNLSASLASDQFTFVPKADAKKVELTPVRNTAAPATQPSPSNQQ